ncbi:MAG: glycosyltransferase family 4 protein [Pseudobdellovibrionaceae bacterium]
MPSMKVAYLITRMDEYGGAQVHIRDLSLGLKGQGHEVHVMSGWPGKVSDYLEHMDIPYTEIHDLVRPISPLEDFKAFKQVRAALKEIKPDILSCHSSKAGLIGRLAARSVGVPVVFTAHGWAFTENVPFIPRMIYRVIETFASLFSSHIVTVSEYDRDLALKKCVAPASKMSAIHNGMPDRAPPKREVRPESEPLQLMMIARFGPQKDHATLIKALAELPADTNWELSLVGGGDNKPVGDLVDALGLTDKVKFLGEREDIGDLLEKADVYFLISHWEGFPRSILEGMRAALPVIATDVAGVKEAVIDGETGYLVPHNDVAGLASVLKHALADRERLYFMGLKGRARFEAEFTFAAMMQKCIHLYQRLIK